MQLLDLDVLHGILSGEQRSERDRAVALQILLLCLPAGNARRLALEYQHDDLASLRALAGQTLAGPGQRPPSELLAELGEGLAHRDVDVRVSAVRALEAVAYLPPRA